MEVSVISIICIIGTMFNGVSSDICTQYRHYMDGDDRLNLLELYYNTKRFGKISYFDTTCFEVFKDERNIKDQSMGDYKVYAYWIPRTNCYGITLNNNETVILQCLELNEDQTETRYFKAIGPEKEEYNTSIKVLGNNCVGITTSRNLTIPFACYTFSITNSYSQILNNYYAWQSADSFKFIPILHDCYQLYDPNHIDVHCFQPAKPENYSCIDWIPGRENECLGLKTPKGEIIEFSCHKKDDDPWLREKPLDNHCFNIYRSTENVSKVCQTKFGNYSIGITTPENFSILFFSPSCETFKNPKTLESYREFVENFSLDPDIRSCYKIFNEDQDISPSYCLSKHIHESCIYKLNTNCTGIMTQNNETVILGCANDGMRSNGTSCFKVYTPNGTLYIACQEKLEERCVGITTPSNLRILFECESCKSKEGGSLPSYTSERRKEYRNFLHNKFPKWKAGNYSFNNGDYLKIANSLQDINELDCYGEIKRYYVHILHGHNNCLGVTMENHETIVLDCPGKKPEKPGCFDIFTPEYNSDGKIIGPDQKVQSVCIKILNERCVGVITPNNWTIPFSCPHLRFAVCSAFVVPNNGPPQRQ